MKGFIKCFQYMSEAGTNAIYINPNDIVSVESNNKKCIVTVRGTSYDIKYDFIGDIDNFERCFLTKLNDRRNAYGSDRSDDDDKLA